MERIEREIQIEENRSLQKYFDKNREREQVIRRAIHENLLTILNDHPQKIKTVRGYKYLGKTIYEYKLVLSGTFACRVAYIFREETILVFYISNTLRKEDYVKLVSGIKGVTKA